jgi:hypothetical protein
MTRTRFPAGTGNFFLATAADRLWDPSRLLFSGYRGVKRPRHEADHSSPCSAKVKNTWSCIFTLPVRLHGAVLRSAHGQLYLCHTWYHILWTLLFLTEIEAKLSAVIHTNKQNCCSFTSFEVSSTLFSYDLTSVGDVSIKVITLTYLPSRRTSCYCKIVPAHV